MKSLRSFQRVHSYVITLKNNLTIVPGIRSSQIATHVLMYLVVFLLFIVSGTGGHISVVFPPASVRATNCSR